MSTAQPTLQIFAKRDLSVRDDMWFVTSRDTPKSKPDLEVKFLHFLNRAYIGNQVTIFAGFFSVPPTQTLKLLKIPMRRNFNSSLIDACFIFLLMRQALLTGAWKPRWFSAGNPLTHMTYYPYRVAKGYFAFKIINLIRYWEQFFNQPKKSSNLVCKGSLSPLR